MVARGYKDTEIGVIPVEWEVKQLKDVVYQDRKITYGIVQPGKNIAPNGIPLIRGKDYSSGKVITDDLYYVSEEIDKPYKRSKVIENDILMTIVGYIGQMAIVPKSLVGANITQTTARISVNKDLYSYQYIYQCFLSYSGYKRLKKFEKGSAQPGLNLADVEKVKIPLPPLKEQEKIADILSTADEKIDAIEGQIQKSQTLKKGLLQKLLSEGIGHSEFKDSELGKIPESWEVDKLENLTTKIGDGLHGTPKYVEKSDYYFINGNNLNGKSIEITENTKCVSEEEYIKNKKILDDTTVLLSINGTVGSLAYYNSETVMLGKSVAYMNSNNNIVKQFLFYLLKSSKILDYFMLELTGTTIKNLSLKTIRNTKIPLPPLKEQKQIADILSTADEKLEVLRAKKDKYETLKKGLLQKLLSGEVRV